MKTFNYLSALLFHGIGLTVLVLLTGCYTVLQQSSEYYSDFDTQSKNRITRDTLIVQNEWESESTSSAESDTEFTEESSTGNKTVIINRFYNDPWYFGVSWGNLYPYYHPYWGWRVSIGWGNWPVYYDPYWYYPYWRPGYYWGWCCYPVDPWYPPYWWSGGRWTYSHYERRNYGMRRYQFNPVTPGGSGVFVGGRSTTTAGAVQVNEGSSRRVYRDGSTVVNEPKDETTTVTARSGNQRKYKSGEATKNGGTKTATGSKERRQYKDNDPNNKQTPRETRTDRNNPSGGNSSREVRNDNPGRSGREYNSGSSGRSDNGGNNSGNSGRSNDRPVRR